MSLRHAHVPPERLAALVLTGVDAGSPADDGALAHVSTCDTCAAELSRLATGMETWREDAIREADAQFPDAMLEASRARILERLTHLGHAARVLPFPGRRPAPGQIGSRVNRRWVSAAAAAGLVVGLLTGQFMHLGSGTVAPPQRAQAPASQPLTTAAAVPVQNVVASPLTYYVSLTQVDSIDQLDRADDIQAFDALTPAPVYIP